MERCRNKKGRKCKPIMINIFLQILEREFRNGQKADCRFVQLPRRLTDKIDSFFEDFQVPNLVQNSSKAKNQHFRRTESFKTFSSAYNATFRLQGLIDIESFKFLNRIDQFQRSIDQILLLLRCDFITSKSSHTNTWERRNRSISLSLSYWSKHWWSTLNSTGILSLASNKRRNVRFRNAKPMFITIGIVTIDGYIRWIKSIDIEFSSC